MAQSPSSQELMFDKFCYTADKNLKIFFYVRTYLSQLVKVNNS